MTIPPNGNEWSDISEVVEAFESALAERDEVDLLEFVPAEHHPQRLAILCELVRVDLERQWELGHPRRLEEYQSSFPSLFEDKELLHAMAFEEFRLRIQAGERPTPAEYLERFGLQSDVWPKASAPNSRRTGGAAPHGTNFRAGDGAAQMERAASAYRLYRERSGTEPDSLSSLLKSFHVPPAPAELLRSLDQKDPHAAERLADALIGLPRVGGEFIGFHLTRELGRGAFGRVFLARQGDLADRLVALKVSADVAGESHALARLQHTNVVPIYSVHRRGPLQAVCMPYLGSTTLADTLTSVRSQERLPNSGQGLLSSLRSGNASSRSSKLPSAKLASRQDQPSSIVRENGVVDFAISFAQAEPPASPQVERLRGLGYVPAVLWIASRVADGLAHAHERGILHRDLKPANILFSEDGEPVLLDFNLAADTTARAGAAVALVGGTLPYMAPEQLYAFIKTEPSLDPRSDVFSLGVIIYELLTGVHPFPLRTGDVDAILKDMHADRLGEVPDVRAGNPSVSPAVASIVRHCLEPDLERRYASARELHEDLNRQLDNQPLLHASDPSFRERFGKWARRNPRLTSSTTVGLVALALLAVVGTALFLSQKRYAQVRAAESFRELGNDRRKAIALLTTPYVEPELVDEALGLCRSAAERYGVSKTRHWLSGPLAAALQEPDRMRLRNDIGELLVLQVQALLRRAAGNANPERSRDLAEAESCLEDAESCYEPGLRPRALLMSRADLARAGGQDDRDVRRLVEAAERVPLRNERERLLLDPNRVDQKLREQILNDAHVITDGNPQNYAVWFALGNWNARFGKAKDALTAYNMAVAMAPEFVWARYNRGVHYIEMKEYSQAIEDFDAFIKRRPDLTPAYLNRGLAKLEMADAQGAIDDLTRCLSRKDAPSRAWFIRARARQRLGDVQGAMVDRERGLKEQPGDPASFVARGIARLPRDTKGALADFDSALAIDPKYRHALQDKASVLSEYLGRAEEGIKVLDIAVDTYPSFIEARMGRAVLQARLGFREAAVRDVDIALRLNDDAQTLYQAACVYALSSKRVESDFQAALRDLAAAVRKDGSWLAVSRRDSDLDPLRARPEFNTLIEAFGVVIRPGSPG